MTKTERERLQEIACDLCHQPYACANEDELAKACEECPISAEMCEMEDEPIVFHLEIPKERLDECIKKVVDEMKQRAGETCNKTENFPFIANNGAEVTP